MQKVRGLSVIVKPDTITWDDISQVLRLAHQKNIEEGITMHNPFLPPDKIKEKIDKMGGVMFVALLEGKLVGTGAVAIREKKWWCSKGQIGYVCFGGFIRAFLDTTEKYLFDFDFLRHWYRHEKTTFSQRGWIKFISTRMKITKR